MRLAVFILGFVGLVAFLAWQFPYALSSDSSQLNLLKSSILIAVLGSFVLLNNRMKLSDTLRYGLAWLAVFIVAVLGYTYKDALLDSRLGAALVPNRVRVAEDGSMQLQARDDGHFHVEARANGVAVNFMIDTGASDVVLSQRDAERMGIDTASLSYTRRYQTANGMTKAAPIRIQLKIGNITLNNFPASVNEGAMDGSLLGMSALSALGGFSVQDNLLIIGKGTRE